MKRYALMLAATTAWMLLASPAQPADGEITLRELIRRNPESSSYSYSRTAAEDRQRLIDRAKADLPAYLAETRMRFRWAKDATAAEVLGEIGDPRAIPRLIELLDSGEYAVQTNAENALVQIGTPAAAPLIELLNARGRHSARAARLLGHIGDKRAANALAELLDERDSSLRLGASQTLAAMGDKRATSTLIEYLYGLRHSNYFRALHALGNLGDTAAIEPLLKILQEGDSQERHAAATALGATQSERCAEPLLAVLRTHLVDEAEAAKRRARDNPLACMSAPDTFPQTVATALARIGEPAIPPCVAALEDPQPEVRRAAAEALLEMATGISLEVLTSNLTSDEPMLREFALRAHAKLGDRKALDAIVAQLAKETTYSQWSAAAEALACVSGRDHTRLVPLLKHDSRPVRIWAAEAIVIAGPEKAMPALLKSYQDPRNAGTSAKEVIHKAFASTRYQPAVPVLVKELSSAEPWIAPYAARCLGDMRQASAVPQLIAAVNRSDDVNLLYYAIEALGKIGDDAAIECLTAALAKEKVREVTIAALVAMNSPPAAKALIDDSRIRDYRNGEPVKALVAMGEIAVSAVAESLLTATDAKQAATAASILGQIGSDSARTALRKAAAELTGDLRVSAISNLSITRDTESLAMLIDVLKSDELAASNAASGSLGNIGSPAVMRLIGLLDISNSPRVRMLAARTLGVITDPRAIEPLAKTLDDESKEVRDAAAWSLVELGDARGAPWLASHYRGTSPNRKFVVQQGCAILGAAAVNIVVDLMRDEREAVRKDAGLLLFSITDRRAIAPLMRALQIEDDHVRTHVLRALVRLRAFEATHAIALVMASTKNEAVRREAVFALAALGDRRAMPELIGLLEAEDPKIRTQAASFLGGLCEPIGVAPLVRATKDSDANVRSAAVWALINIGGERAIEALQDFVARTEDAHERFHAELALQTPFLKKAKPSSRSSGLLFEYPEATIRVGLAVTLAGVIYWQRMYLHRVE
jgi:HEAT repeat protein